MLNSRAKGVRGELQVAHMFQEYGYDAQRGYQHDGMLGHADVEGVPYIWIECKWNEDLDVTKAIKQAERDSDAYMRKTGKDVFPVVIRKKSRRPWMVTMRLGDMAELFTGGGPFLTDAPGDGLVHMLFEDWIKVYCMYEQWRSEHD